MRSWQCAISLAALGVVLCPRGEAAAVVDPQGEWAARIALVHERIMSGEVPRFTQNFILADVMLDPAYPRRFSEYSGDVSGRVIGALACMPRGDTGPLLDAIVQATLRCQRADGRFGNEALVFTPEKIGMEHMALLWGNGRLLVGLLEYNAAYPNPDVAASARKLGDFLLTIHDACAKEEVRKAVADLAAAGIICFTQLVEPLTVLYQATGDTRYLDGAKSVAAWLPEERGKQHSHGYLSTLRGALMLSEASHDPALLAWVERLYESLVQSNDYEVYGGVRELFGHANDNDEGCSEADFLRLSLHLARLTGKAAYWERAERCLLNQFFANQFDTGDFGHHVYDAYGERPAPGVGRAWWCCTMHGLRAFRDIEDSLVTKRDGTYCVNLFLDAKWRDEQCALQLTSRTSEMGRLAFTVSVEQAPENGVSLSFRRPVWTTEIALCINGVDSVPQERDGCLVAARPLAKGDRIELVLNLAPRFLTRDNQWLASEALKDTATEAALFVGPWLVGVDAGDNPAFFGEPWGGNRIAWPPRDSTKACERRFELPCAQATCPYVHDGFPGEQLVTLRPISERTGHVPMPFAVWLRYGR